MNPIKLTALTKGQLEEAKVLPVNVEDYTEDTINGCFPEIKLLELYSRSHGSIVRETDEILFRMCCRDEENNNVTEKRWIEIEGDFYDVVTAINALEEGGYDVENDL